MSTRLTGAGFEAVADDQDGKGGLAVMVTQPRGSTARYRCQLYAQTPVGNMLVGEFTVCPPTQHLSRVVAIATCPGAVRWILTGNTVGGTVADNGLLDMAVGVPAGSEPGVRRISERFKQYSGSVAAVVSLLAGETLTKWTANSSAGGTLLIDTNPLITIPAGVTISGGDQQLIKGPATLTFAGDIDSYIVEVAQSS